MSALMRLAPPLLTSLLGTVLLGGLTLAACGPAVAFAQEGGSEATEAAREGDGSEDRDEERRVFDAEAVVRWVTLATSSAVLLSGAVFFGVGESDLDDVEDAAPGTPWTEVEAEFDSANDKITLGIVGMVVGGVATAASVAWILASTEDVEERATLQLELRPTSFALRGTFE